MNFHFPLEQRMNFDDNSEEIFDGTNPNKHVLFTTDNKKDFSMGAKFVRGYAFWYGHH